MNRAEREHEAYLRGKIDAIRELERERSARLYTRVDFWRGALPTVLGVVFFAAVVGLCVVMAALLAQGIEQLPVLRLWPR